MKKLLTVLCFLCSVNLLSAQSFCFDLLGAESIISVTDDNDYIWCGTEDNGLLRVDKLTYQKEYTNMANSQLKSNRIKSVLVYNDKLYLSSDSTLMVLEGEALVPLHEDMEGLLLENDEGNLTVTGRRDFYILNTANEILNHQHLMDVVWDQCCSQFTEVALAPNGDLWLSHYDFYEFDVLKYDGAEWSVFDINNSILPVESFAPNQITTLGDQIIASNYAGLYVYDNEEWSVYHSISETSIENEWQNIDGLGTLAVEADSDDILWVAADNGLENTTEKIAYLANGSWNFISNEGENFSKINFFQESTSNPDVMFAGTAEGLLSIDKNCLIPNIGIEEMEAAEKLSLYPIPVKDNLHIELDEEILHWAVYGLDGKVLLKGTKNDSNLNLSAMKAGLYLLEIQTNTQQISKSFVKE